MNLIKTSFFTGCLTFIRFCSGFIINKVFAIYLGPPGIALVGQFSNLVSIVSTFGNGAINNGIVKYSAEYRNDNEKLAKLISTSARITLVASAFICALLAIFRYKVSFFLFKTSEFGTPILVLGVSVFFSSLNGILLSILNGLGDIKNFTYINGLNVLFSLGLSILFVVNYKVAGALYAIIIPQAAVVFVTIAFIWKSKNKSVLLFLLGSFSSEKLKLLARFSLMAIVTAVTAPVSQMLIRDQLIHEFNYDFAGYWQAMMRLSDAYLMIIITTLSIYYLPKLSGLKSKKDLLDEVTNGFKIIIPAISLICLVAFLFRYPIITLLYTKKFYPMEELFAFQLLGDIVKIASWLLGYVIVAKAMTKLFIITEIIFTITYLVLSYIMVHIYGFKGISIAFFINYTLSFLFFLFYFRKILALHE